MLTLITGAPGTGKSAATVKMLQDWHDKGRPIYVDGIPELTIPHTVINGDEWHQVVPDGAIICVDEAQRIWRPTGPGQKPSPSIAALETHRHRGLDLLVVTQHPKLIHTNVRSLVGRHVHLRDLGILGRHWYEWPECGDPGSWRSAPVKVRYRLPKAILGKYKSATEHIKPVRKIPPVLLLLFLLVPLLCFLVYRTYGSIAEKNAPKPPPAAAAVMPQGVPAYSGTRQAAAPPATAADLVMASTPRLGEDPRSAPMFDEVRKVVRMPRIMGGWCRAGVCRCYIDDAMKAPISSDACARWVADPPFDAYHQPSKDSIRDRMQGGSREAGANAMAPGHGGAAPVQSSAVQRAGV